MRLVLCLYVFSKTILPSIGWLHLKFSFLHLQPPNHFCFCGLRIAFLSTSTVWPIVFTPAVPGPILPTQTLASASGNSLVLPTTATTTEVAAQPIPLPRPPGDLAPYASTGPEIGISPRPMSYSASSHSTRQRSRLSNSDVKLILYLIAQIKPFKYVGDRTLSQSRKWDLIQQKFERYKLGSGLAAISVPTVRTLQRQMANALRKAQTLELGNLPRPPFDVFRTLLLLSPLADLERAVLELYNVSEAYKTGQTVGPLPEIIHLLADASPTEELGVRSADSPESPNSLDLGDDSDEVLRPVSTATLVSRLQDLAEENAAFFSESMSMLRRHSDRMAEKYAQLEMLLSAGGRRARLLPHEDVPRLPKDTAVHAPSKESAEAADEAPHAADRLERLLGSIQVLLN